MIRPFHPDDIAQITQIYNHYIEHDTATFEEVAIDEGEMLSRFAQIGQSFPILVLENPQQQIVGYAYGNHFKPRTAYRFCAETTIYLDPTLRSQGDGTRLYQALLDALKAQGILEVLGVVTQPNAASDALHSKLGYQRQGVLNAVGYKFERWLDVAMWQKSFRT